MYYPVRIIIKYLPPRLIAFIGIIGGHLLYFLSKKKYTLMADELRRVFPDKQEQAIQQIMKRSLANFCTSELEVLLYPVLNQRRIAQIVKIEGREHLDNALSKGKGVLLFQTHFGSFQMVMPAIGYSGYTMNQISAPASMWKEATTSGIQKKGFEIKAGHEYTLPVKHIAIKSYLRPVFRALEKNEIVGVTVDGGSGDKWVTIKFLGRDANFSQGPVNIAIRTGAAIVPAFMITEKNLSHTLHIHAPLEIDETQDRNNNIQKILREIMGLLEQYVYQYPEHYGYMLYFRRSLATVDPYPFFEDYERKKREYVT